MRSQQKNPLHQIDEDACRQFQVAAELAGKKWSAAILLSLARGSTRFSEVRRTVAGISDRLLSARLQELEHQGLVHRDIEPSTPVQITYGLTESGRELMSALNPLVEWGRRWMSEEVNTRAEAT